MSVTYTLRATGNRLNGTKTENIELVSHGADMTEAGYKLILAIEGHNPYRNHPPFCEEVDGGHVWWTDEQMTEDQLADREDTYPVYYEDTDDVDFYLHTNPLEPTSEAIRRFALSCLDVHHVNITVTM